MSAKFAGTEIEIRLGSNVRYRRFGIKTGQSGYDPIADIAIPVLAIISIQMVGALAYLATCP